MPTPRPTPRRERRSKGARGDLVGSSAMHVESRPSMLSADRIALTQHSGRCDQVLGARLWGAGSSGAIGCSHGGACSDVWC